MKITVGSVIAAAVAFVLLMFLFYPVGHTKADAKKAACISNVKHWQHALMMYAEANNDLLPFRDAWMDAAEPHVTSERLQYMKCTEVFTQKLPGYGYAFNSRLSRKKHSSIPEPEKTPMVYDSLNLAKNASDPVLSIPSPGRHEGTTVIGYVDGHVTRKK